MTRLACPIFLCLIIMLHSGTTKGEMATEFRNTLSAEEQAWLTAHPVIRYVVDPNFAPVDFVDQGGHYRGMGADYLGLIAERLGLRFARVETNNFYEALKLVQEGQADLLPVATETPNRSQYLLFTKPYLQFPAIVITARTDVEDWSFANLRMMRIAVVHGYNWEEWLTTNFPDVELVQTPDIETALMTTSFGLADVMVGDSATTTYIIGKTNIANLRVARRLEQNLQVSMAVRNDWPVLLTILNKALASIREEVKQSINKNWIHLEPLVWWKNPTFQLIALGSLASLTGIILAALAWNRTLARKVRLRTMALEEAHLRLMHSAKMESVGQLAAGVAHEVKNPLAIIQMGLDFISLDVPQESETAAVICDMEEAVQRADGIIKGLLDFSREKKLEMLKTNLNEVVRDSLKLVNYELSHHNITVEEALSPAIPLINADPDKLKQVFVNIFMNAIQAMGRDGKLRVMSEVKRLEKGIGKRVDATGKLSPGDRVILINVDDTGPGIDPAKAGKVFDPFFTTKPLGKGTGLGLSVSRTIVELHEGVINLHNRNGGGASAEIMFKIV